jgi:prepilin-type N-terminal cleavage/methylation domain-containing protein
MGTPAKRGSKQAGFTLIELLSAMAIMAVLLGIGAIALRNYWWNQGLLRAEDEVVAQLTNLQDLSVSESNPITYGARFTDGSGTWHLVKFNGNSASTTTDDTCADFGAALTFADGVVISDATFSTTPVLTTKCRTIAGAGSDEFVFFFPRGTATAGHVDINSTKVNKTRTVSVTPITGKVDS